MYYVEQEFGVHCKCLSEFCPLQIWPKYPRTHAHANALVSVTAPFLNALSIPCSKRRRARFSDTKSKDGDFKGPNSSNQTNRARLSAEIRFPFSRYLFLDTEKEKVIFECSTLCMHRERVDLLANLFCPSPAFLLFSCIWLVLQFLEPNTAKRGREKIPPFFRRLFHALFAANLCAKSQDTINS